MPIVKYGDPVLRRKTAPIPQIDEALLYNRKLWSIFLTSVTRADNPLPAMVRQNVANLGIFVLNQTLSLIAEPKRVSAGFHLLLEVDDICHFLRGD